MLRDPVIVTTHDLAPLGPGPGGRSGAGYVILSVSYHLGFLYQPAMVLSRLRK